MARLLLLVAVAGLAIISAVAHTPKQSEDDFAFDSNDDFQIDISGSLESVKSSQTLRRLWGVPDTSAYVGRLFRLEIPKEAFSGGVSAYKVTGTNKQPLPLWLALDSKHGILTGVASRSDVGSHTLTVTAHGKVPGRKAEDTFTVEVRRDLEKPLVGVGGARCLAGEDELILVILLDRPFHFIKPKQKIKALMSLSNFMGIDGEAFSIDSYNVHDSSNTNYTVFQSGPGNAKKTHNEQSAIYLNVGCSGHLWTKHKLLVHQLREQARDGSVSALTQLPVLAWQVLSKSHKPDPRLKRQAEEGSALYDLDDDEQEGDDYSGYSDDYDDDHPLSEVDPAIPLPRTTSSTAAPTSTPTFPTTTPTTRTTPSTLPTHPHRHHHGEPTYPDTSGEDSSDVLKNTESDIFIRMELTSEIPIVELVEFVTKKDVTVVNNPTVARVHTTEYISEIFTAQTPLETNEYQSNKNKKLDKATETVHIPSPTNPPTLSITTQRPSEDTTPLATAITTNAIVEKDIEIVPDNDHEDEQTEGEKTFEESRDKSVLHRNSSIQIVPDDNVLAATTPQSTLLIEPSNLPLEPFTVVTPHLASVTTTTEKVQLFTTPTTPLATIPSTALTVPAPPPTPSTPPTQLVETFTEERTTTEQEAILPMEKSSTIVGRTTETVDVAFPANSAPTLNYRMKKIAVTSGKAFRYIIPEDLFTDLEDGSALTLRMYDSDMAALSSDSWVQFLPKDREVYGLPLEEHVFKWEYIVEARDSQGATAVDRLDITVQQHKGRRAVNHELQLKMKVVQKYPAAVNWQIRALEGLVNLFGDTDMDQIMVREINRDNDLVEFVWTNDTLPKNECPTKQIDQLLNILRADESGSPSSALSDVMAPELKARWVGWRPLGVCQAAPMPPVAAPAPPRQPDNFPPVPRNQVDYINATVGHLLVFKVPEDTFFDPEDGSARSLHLDLVRGDRSALPPLHWLQFDSNNQEFYGLPTERDIGKKDYQLIAKDSGGLTANDGLIVEVLPAPTLKHNVEFSMTLGMPLATIVSSAKVKRHLLQKMQQLLYDEEASSIQIKSITDLPTTIAWYNTSLPIDHCPNEEIQRLRKILVQEGGSLTSRVDEIMGAEFPVMSISLTPRGACAGRGASIGTSLDPGAPLNTHTQQTGATFGKMDDYLITFIIPAIIVICMIIIAGVIACVLYRRRKTGKMSLGDEEERQAFRSKGIPVIFQDELDEKPDPSNKSPVIMKEEKPPLLPPPSYGGADSPAPSPRAPYHPPPPFPPNRESARNSRAKATPTYRKPPPYVPP